MELHADVRDILQVIETVGTVTYPQVDLIYKARTGKENSATVVKFLINGRYVKDLNGYISPKFERNPSRQKSDCFWVYLDIISDDEGNIDLSKMTNLVRGITPVDFAYIQTETMIVNMVYVDSVAKAALINQNYMALENNAGDFNKGIDTMYMLVASSKEVVAGISQMDLAFKNRIALVTSNGTDKPQIDYFINEN